MRVMMLGLLVLITLVTVVWNIPLRNYLGNTEKVVLTAAVGTSQKRVAGSNLHLQECGITWDNYYVHLPMADPIRDMDRAFLWTVAGGFEYGENVGIIMQAWERLGIFPVLVVALEKKISDIACELGFFAVYWDRDIASYSRVADAKFNVAGLIADRGYRGFFMEMDVFCRKNPVPLFLEQEKDLVNVGHGDVGYFVNIGTFLASPRMGPFFRGLVKVLSFSLKHKMHTNQANWTVEFFDQDVYKYCLPISKQNLDDDVDGFQFEYYLLDDVDRKHDLLKYCQDFKNFTHVVMPHHVMSNHDPPTVFDSTYCIHPLSYKPFSPLAFKMGTAKFFGFDPKPIGSDEKLLKLHAGDLEFNNCWNRVTNEGKRMNKDYCHHVIGMLISALIEIAKFTNRTLVLPQYIRSKESWAIPTHAVLDVRTLGLPYRSMTREQAFALPEDDTVVVYAAHNFSETFRRTVDRKYKDVKVLSIMKICNIRDHKLPILEKRRKTLGWCIDKDLEWSRAVGAWMDFCQSY
jgi:hypothetical protein